MSEEYRVAAGEAVELVARLLERGDVSSVSVHDIDGEILMVLPGVTAPEDGAQRLLDSFQNGAGGPEVLVVAETADASEELVSSKRVVADRPAFPEGEEPPV